MLDTSPAPGDVTSGRPVASYRTDLVTALLSIWFTVGLMVDAWAHNNIPRLETFFTPWHAVFYSGFAVTAGWIAWTVRGSLPAGWAGLKTMPVGYAPALLAVAGFAVAGGADATWHTVFGIEQNINILFSPTHLALATAMIVIIATPLRSAWADPAIPARPGLARLLPAVLATALSTTLVLLFIQYANAFVFGSGDVMAALTNQEEGFTDQVVTSVALTNLVLLLPLLTLARRWVLPFGTATIIFATVGALSGAVTGLRHPAIIVGLLVTGVLVDLLAQWLRPTPARPVHYRTFAALTPLVVWSGYLLTAALTAPPLDFGPGSISGHPEDAVELYTGIPAIQALFGLLLAILLVPGRIPAAPADPR
jgi:hypothetical protein